MAGSESTPHAVPLYRSSQRPRTATLNPDCVVALKALGEDTRVRIVGLLMDEPLDVSEISRRVGVSQYNVSKHLRILREAGLLQVEKAGRRHLYALADGIRNQAALEGILDLGCCSFKFERRAGGTARARARNGRAIEAGTRTAR